jgi:hypothetical protein
MFNQQVPTLSGKRDTRFRAASSVNAPTALRRQRNYWTSGIAGNAGIAATALRWPQGSKEVKRVVRRIEIFLAPGIPGREHRVRVYIRPRFDHGDTVIPSLPVRKTPRDEPGEQLLDDDLPIELNDQPGRVTRVSLRGTPTFPRYLRNLRRSTSSSPTCIPAVKRHHKEVRLNATRAKASSCSKI